MPIYLPELSLDTYEFPNVETALTSPDGLLAMGGDLSLTRIINAYRNGIFPWFSDDEPILWWSPSVRAMIKPTACHISKSMKRVVAKKCFTVTVNHAFNDVIHACAQPRKNQNGTWITENMMKAYIDLHHQGYAHSIEVWQTGKLVGGLYGINIGTIFCGESMFSLVDNSSKLAFIALNKHFSRFQGILIDCQMPTPHLQTLGVYPISREQYMCYLRAYRDKKVLTGCWTPQQLFI
ncbi:leucyl/phenylalanyl-tRNA--protein transferase [Psychromonas sp. MME2]|uniref:leucyl/phenylalanyl-tRNA--protein transferase n=1 Tax=unclassified Psychromonas TaxID=2614957 RepID=UPI00339C2783